MLERIYAVHTPSTSLSDGVPGAFLTGANSSSRKVSMIASAAAGKMYKWYKRSKVYVCFWCLCKNSCNSNSNIQRDLKGQSLSKEVDWVSSQSGCSLEIHQKWKPPTSRLRANLLKNPRGGPWLDETDNPIPPHTDYSKYLLVTCLCNHITVFYLLLLEWSYA